jgi:hypothetical protein
MKTKNMNRTSNKDRKNAASRAICPVSGRLKVDGVLDFWWASLLTSEKMLAMHICFMLQRVRPGKRIEIRRELGSIRAKLVNELDRAERGWLQVHTLPPVSGGARN